MKTLIATLLATAAGAAFAAPTFALNHDPASYRAATQKAAADYKAATAKCGSMSGNDKDVCMAEAKLTRTRTEADALSKYNTSAASKTRRAPTWLTPSTTWPRPGATPRAAPRRTTA